MKMRKFYSNKLWRDKLPGILQAMGSIVHTKQITDGEYEQALRVKLAEEAQEVQAAKNREELAEELADILEVINSLCALHDLSRNEIEAVQAKKRDERGGFAGRTFVTTVEHQENSWGERYCLAQPEKYPEID